MVQKHSRYEWFSIPGSCRTTAKAMSADKVKKAHNYSPLTNGMKEETRWRPPSFLWIPLIVCGCLLFIVDVFQLRYYTITPTKIESQSTADLLLIEQSMKGFLVKTPGCRIPYMDPMDPNIRKFIHKVKKPICNNGTPALFEITDVETIEIVDSAIGYYVDLNTTNPNALRCCYRPFWRLDTKPEESDDRVKFDKKCKLFVNKTKITDEFVRVECAIGGATVYKDFFSFVPIKTNNNIQSVPNILIVGIDAVSRLNFHRQMPKTVDYLLKNLSAIELLGYNKVADNTFPNLIPFLTGLSEEELRGRCWPEESTKFDDCPFVWNDYKTKGYVTSFGEDSSWMGIFNYLRRGFKKQPTDYSWGIFNRISEQQIGNSYNMNVKECVGSRQVYKVLLDYISRFTVRMDSENLAYFALYWGASLTHDYLNKPSLGDRSYEQFFKNLNLGNHLNNTVLIVMSDHGIRWGDIRQTFQGRMEERLPFMFIKLPDWLIAENPPAYRNLIKNTRKLTTPFDMHETLTALLHPHDIVTSRTQPVARAYSLFTEITANRSCEDASISSHWCTCQQSFEIDRNDSMVIESATFAVDFMNRQLEGYAQCANLTLHAILDARLMSHGDEILNGNKVQDFMITLQTLPGEGVFEVTVRTTAFDKTSNRSAFEVMGTISRLNLYGKQSSCITDFHLKLYCYCKNFMALI